MSRGKFIVIEGTDGSGKTTQFELLIERLRRERVSFATFDFPRYSEPSAYFVSRYLNGDYGTLEEVGAKRASLFFALDRYEASFEIRSALEKYRVVLSNRYVGSNMGHQGSKMNSRSERKEYFEWIANLEFNILGIPKPDLNILLHLPAEEAYRLVGEKEAREYLRGKKRDIHEGDVEHLRRTEETYIQMAELFPDTFNTLECMDGNRLMSREEIHEKVWALVEKKLGN